jgi:hypothetical protein
MLWLGGQSQEVGPEEVLGLSVVRLCTPSSGNPVPEKVARIWAEEWAKEGKKVDWQRLLAPKGFQVLPRRWVVERTFALGSRRTGE